MDFNEMKKTVEAFADVKEKLNEMLNDCMETVKYHSEFDGSWEKDIAELYQRKADIYTDLVSYLDKLFKSKI